MEKMYKIELFVTVENNKVSKDELLNTTIIDSLRGKNIQIDTITIKDLTQ